jgi:hypothetical protein
MNESGIRRPTSAASELSESVSPSQGSRQFPTRHQWLPLGEPPSSTRALFSGTSSSMVLHPIGIVVANAGDPYWPNHDRPGEDGTREGAGSYKLYKW